MTASTFKDAYYLPRDKVESVRLETQHQLIVQNAGFVLHPILAAKLPANARIADIATGTGIWMKDVARTAPSTWSFTGFDLSDAQFPEPSQRDGHSFQLLNILEPIPKDLEASFDAVHVRYLICALSSEAWTTVANNLLTLLKPGGYLQWFESDFPNIKNLQPSPTVGMSAMQDLRASFLELCWEAGTNKPSVVNPGLKLNVEKAGFVDVTEDIIASDRVAETRKESALVSLQAMKGGMANGIRMRGGWRRDEKWVEGVAEEAVREVERGVYARWDMHVVTARRPI